MLKILFFSILIIFGCKLVNLMVLLLMFFVLFFLLGLKFSVFYFYFSSGLFIDKLGMLMVLMVLIVLGFIFYYGYNNMFLFNVYFCFLNFITVVIFMMHSFFLMFVFYEFIFFPLFLFMNLVSYSFERLNSSFYLMVYLLLFSYPFVYLMLKLNLMCFYYLLINFYLKNFYFILYLMVFLTKVSMFFFHYWLIKVHVEVSIDSSVYFSSILMKLGGYGVMRMYFFILNDSLMVFYLSFIGFILFSILNFLNNDLKIIIAFSSIIYMNLSLFIVSLNSYYGMSGLVFINLFHSLSSMIFFFSFGIFNNISKSRLLLMNTGYVSVFDNLLFLFIILFYLNLFSPLTLGFMGELIIFVILFYKMKLMFFVLLLLFLLNMIYNSVYFLNLGLNNFFFSYLNIDMKVSFYIIFVIVGIYSSLMFLKLGLFMIF